MPTISGQTLKDRMLARFAAAAEAQPVDVVSALSSPNNRDLMALILHRRPGSISELSDLAGRAQPNVSRSINALVSAGLITIQSDGRRSIPSLTPLGQAKADELRLTLTDIANDEPAPIEPVAEPTQTAFTLAITPTVDDAPEDTDCVRGTVSACVTNRHGAVTTLSRSGDTTAFAYLVAEHWWRMLYRRDAPFKLGDFNRDGTAEAITVTVRSTGRIVELMTRNVSNSLTRQSQTFQGLSISDLEDHWIASILKPAVATLRGRYRFDRPLESLVSRIEDSRSYAEDRQFCRTAGALGLSPYGLGEGYAGRIRSLISEMADEDARLDFASAVLNEDFEEGSRWAHAEINDKGPINTLDALIELRHACHIDEGERGARPWEFGTALARAARRSLRMELDQPVGHLEGLSRLAGLDRTVALSPEAPGSLKAFQSTYDDRPTVVLENRSGTANTFVLARAIGEYLAFGSRNACVSGLYTQRQAVGRAFAAELIAPALGVIHMIDDEDQPEIRVARHYGASLQMIKRQYDNNYNFA